MDSTKTKAAAEIETAGLLSQLPQQRRRDVLMVFARSLGFVEDLNYDQCGYIAWSILNQDRDSGRLATAQENPFFDNLRAVDQQRLEVVVRVWLSLRDNAVWAGLKDTIHANSTLTPAQQLCLIDLNRLARSRTRQECLTIRAYSRAWPTRSRATLIRTIGALPDIAMVCDYMATYKPKGLVPAAPFGLAAEIVVNTLRFSEHCYLGCSSWAVLQT